MLDTGTRQEIDGIVQRILNEMGVKDPPLTIESVIEHLSIDHSYYSLEDPGLLREIWHRLKIGSAKATTIFQKIGLQGLWLPDETKIIVDIAVAPARRKWVNAHEVMHKLIPSHADLLLGDTAETLDPEYHEMIEAEANYGASALIFLGERFKKDALDSKSEFRSVQKLKQRYSNSLVSTLRRFVVSGDKPMVGIVSTPFWANLNEGKPRLRYSFTSKTFRLLFSKVKVEDILSAIEPRMSEKRGGMLATDLIQMRDDTGKINSFLFEAFYNQYDILTLVSHWE